MKIKQVPDDFRVEEMPAFDPESVRGAPGKFALYRLDKRDWTTPDALTLVRKRWKLHPHSIGFGGLKDRHARTIQYFTVYDGPPKDLSDNGLTVTHLGAVSKPYSSDDVRANAFAITIRDANSAEVSGLWQAIPELATIGVPNYFDDQRFGGVGPDGRFVAREMVKGNFEEALKMALAGEIEHDRSSVKRRKAVLREHWGKWPLLASKLPRGDARDIVEGLARKPDFAAACGRLWPDDQGLHLSAWQSHLWNRMLDRWITDHTQEVIPVALKTATVHMPIRFDDAAAREWAEFRLPYPSARLKLDPEAPWAGCVSATMKEEGIPLEEMKVPGMRKPFFSKGDRAAKLIVSQLTGEDAPDDKHPNRRKATLAFELPRGAYATMVLKRLTTRMIDGQLLA
ncbi:tRNA pseudouridine(13) synthase TruD [Zavarzinella formosa]|uniref:tRNA pseudouridine(13) synthase TruD n=1 Tax=Zavarzinella formosa TaxID=360055 RepID=UPI000307306C|nr:tRNA pseudouridine(13) synthase TruD [Zavarzinella formosa]